ncbi:DUF1028 domain-containing protein [Rhizobium sp.]|jgi:uncharacterized Ntn-hydrolase superfamily protein|uniref:DUF1028 domain-containing protein n=1 Tax=Rhizobium sp. TaxID=391 RepID=UPI000E867CB5|nr:DUF1028 domain-containing protein [Rhizobium sp.]
MTWSIVARDPMTGYLGIAVSSRFFSVGTLVPHIRGGIGAIATQAFVNPLYGVDGLALLASGTAPDAIINILTDADAGSAQRQFHVIDNQGRNAAFTGNACVDWAGHLMDQNVSVAGNMLAGPDVVAATLEVFQKTEGKPMAERFLQAMQAGQDAGGDKRGKQSAAIVLFRDQDYPWLRLHVDDHADPLSELARLYAVAQERYLHVAETMPTRANPSGMLDRSIIDRKITELEASRQGAGQLSASYATPWKP